MTETDYTAYNYMIVQQIGPCSQKHLRMDIDKPLSTLKQVLKFAGRCVKIKKNKQFLITLYTKTGNRYDNIHAIPCHWEDNELKPG